MASKLSSKYIKFEWNYTNSVIIGRKGFGKVLNKKIADIFAKHMDKYVPWDSTNSTWRHLAKMVRTTATKDHGTITYMVPWAKYQYVGPKSWGRDLTVHPLATSKWDKVCWRNEKQEIIAEIDRFRRWRRL